jgi:putative aminopeptidase FrvX
MIPRQLALLLALLLSPLAADAVTLEDEVEAFLQVPAVVGREEPAAEFLEGRLAGLPVSRDALGNLTVTLGSGSPRRLVACPMGEPGYVVSRILDNGYLRLIPAGGAPRPALWDQSHFGQTVVIGGARGWIPGAVVLPSVHLMEGRSRPPEKPVAVDDLWVDVGAESSAEVEEMGVRLLDAVALVRRPSRIGGLVAAPSARLRGACMAAAEAARRVHASPGTGTTVFAWTTLDIFNQKGIEHLVRRMGPFGEAILVSPGFGWKLEENNFTFEPLPRPGSGLLGAGDLPKGLSTQAAPHMAAFNDGFVRPPSWVKARVGYLGLPALYPESLVETISLAEVKRLADALAGNRTASAPPLPPPPPLVEAVGHDEEAKMLANLIGRYGVSGAEDPVREEIARQLPSWAKPETDAKGNLLVTVQLGRGAVLRAMDNLNQTPRELIDRFLDLAERNGIPIQYGMTGGSSDGLAFAANGPEMLPFSWPGRYSHSPVEVADLRDVESLVRLVVAAITN